MIDSPGSNMLLNEAVLSAVDCVAVPMMFSAMDTLTSKVTFSMIVNHQKENQGRPVFLGFIPNDVPRRGGVARRIVGAGEDNFVTQCIHSGMLLPYIRSSSYVSDLFLRTGAKTGGVTVPLYAPRSDVADNLRALWIALNMKAPDRAAYQRQLHDFLGLLAEAQQSKPVS
jgi:cellulose biosynthesis protein BcsQ